MDKAFRRHQRPIATYPMGNTMVVIKDVLKGLALLLAGVWVMALAGTLYKATSLGSQLISMVALLLLLLGINVFLELPCFRGFRDRFVIFPDRLKYIQKREIREACWDAIEVVKVGTDWVLWMHNGPLQLDNTCPHVEELVALIQRQLARQRLSRLMEQCIAGATITFSDVAINRQGVAIQTYSLSSNKIAEAFTDELGVIWLWGRGSGYVQLGTTDDIVDAPLLITLVNHILATQHSLAPAAPEHEQPSAVYWPRFSVLLGHGLAAVGFFCAGVVNALFGIVVLHLVRNPEDVILVGLALAGGVWGLWEGLQRLRLLWKRSAQSVLIFPDRLEFRQGNQRALVPWYKIASFDGRFVRRIDGEVFWIEDWLAHREELASTIQHEAGRHKMSIMKGQQ